jgi:hypothetical protein
VPWQWRVCNFSFQFLSLTFFVHSFLESFGSPDALVEWVLLSVIATYICVVILTNFDSEKLSAEKRNTLVPNLRVGTTNVFSL